VVETSGSIEDLAASWLAAERDAVAKGNADGTEDRARIASAIYDAAVSSSSKAIGPLDPGTHTVRYQYDGQPRTPDLTSGTFRVIAGGSPSSSTP
jgi:hypothetical protein